MLAEVNEPHLKGHDKCNVMAEWFDLELLKEMFPKIENNLSIFNDLDV